MWREREGGHGHKINKTKCAGGGRVGEVKQSKPFGAQKIMSAFKMPGIDLHRWT